MRLRGSSSRGRAGSSALLLTTAVCALLLATPTAGAVSVTTGLVDVEVGVGEGGVDVGVSVPGVGTDVDAGVDLGGGGVEVDVDTPAGNVNAGVGSGSGSGSGSSGSESQGQSNSSTPASEPKRGDRSDTPSGSAASEGTGSDAGSTSDGALGSPESAAGRRANQSGGTASGRTPIGAAGFVSALLPASELVSSPSTVGAAGGNESVVTQLVAYVPTWLWVLFGLVLCGLAAALAYALRERRRRRQSDRLAMLDPLTAIANVKAFDDRMDQEWARARRYGGSLGLLLIDLDHFKEVNDRFGHAAGDKVLMATAEELRAHTRSSDLVARLGGDEFAVICPHTGLRGLRKLRKVLEKELPDEIGYGVGLSIGFAVMRPDDESPSATIHRADEAMYARKALHHQRDGDLAELDLRSA